MSAQELHDLLDRIDFGDGLTRDEIRERAPGLPDSVYLYLPAAKRFRSADEVLRNTGANALARAEGEGEPPDLDMPTEEEIEEEGGPEGFGPSLTGADRTTIGHGDLPGPEDDLAGNSIETSEGRGIPDENE